VAHPSKRKGSGFELEVVKLFQGHGIAAEKVPLSGAVKTSKFDHDISCPVRGKDWKLECKRRGRAFGTLYGWMEGNNALVVRDDKTEPLVVMRLDDFAKLALLPE
jgi:Holliday junction resolvase